MQLGSGVESIMRYVLQKTEALRHCSYEVLDRSHLFSIQDGYSHRVTPNIFGAQFFLARSFVSCYANTLTILLQGRVAVSEEYDDELRDNPHDAESVFPTFIVATLRSIGLRTRLTLQ